MNRMEEYHELMQELEQPVPKLEQTFDRACRKARRRKRTIGSVINVAAVLFLFVGLVNFSEPIATACSKIPLLRELAEAVSFSDSLSAAVANEYVQILSLTQSDDDITATVEYLIVDEKQVTVFFRLDSDVYTDIKPNPVILSADGEREKFCSYHLNEWSVDNGELQSITIDFGQDAIPNSLYLELNIRDRNFRFLLEFNPELSAKPKIYPVHRTLVLDGNEITFTDVEIYPSHLRLNATDSPNNDEWLEILDFYVKTEDGKTFNSPMIGTLTNGIRDSIKSTSTMSYKAESPYFYESDSFEIVITGATWSDKETQNNMREWEAEEKVVIIVK